MITLDLSLKNLSDPTKARWLNLGYDPSELSGRGDELLMHWAVRKRMLEAYPDRTFKPDQPITEAEFLKALCHAYGYPKTRDRARNSVEAVYELASLWNYPVTDDAHSEARFVPMTRLKAAEIITSAQGENYEGNNAITFLLGKSLAKGKSEQTVEGFAGDELLTRSEAVEWIGSMIMKGASRLQERPKVLSDPSLLPLLPVPQSEELPDFVIAPVTQEDFNLIDMEKEVSISLGSTREWVEVNYDIPIRKYNEHHYRYTSFSVHYNESDILQGWKIDEYYQNTKQFQTSKGAILGQSTFYDILRDYGTAGFLGYGNGLSLDYLYEKYEGEIIPRFSPHEIINNDNVLTISFIFDQKTLMLTYITAATYQVGYIGPF
ncbi:S-layer homology domain-containing protein [Paenibacillus periandrae]|uniref:S-layer homology domain-containing protein n=1 Tax=Paenibacillus periandrae TaxID=1761741 RepID=UPI001F089E67|nr:S-layer homology domain-containing protein [Paenibacillus periandrae]